MAKTVKTKLQIFRDRDIGDIHIQNNKEMIHIKYKIVDASGMGGGELIRER